MADADFTVEYAEEQLRRSRHPLRRLIKYFYLADILHDVKGCAVDFGCGAGQLLERLPPGSMGFEINPLLVKALRDRGLNVEHYDPPSDDFSLHGVMKDRFSTLIMAHVLEHFEDPAEVLCKLFRACSRTGVRRIIVTVPGAKGYASDRTHRTFVDWNYLRLNGLLLRKDYRPTKRSYFPVDRESFGNYFTFNELKVVYDRADE
jgi:SAM-dependent methyltransferase